MLNGSWCFTYDKKASKVMSFKNAYCDCNEPLRIWTSIIAEVEFETEQEYTPLCERSALNMDSLLTSHPGVELEDLHNLNTWAFI